VALAVLLAVAAPVALTTNKGTLGPHVHIGMDPALLDRFARCHSPARSGGLTDPCHALKTQNRLRHNQTAVFKPMGGDG
jgi:hypothetical protein